MGDRRSVPGSTLAVKPGEVTLYRFPNHTPLRWNVTWRTDCRTVIYSNDAASTVPAGTVFPAESAARWAAGPGPAPRTSGPTVEAGPTDGITYSAPEFIRAGQSIQSFVDVRALWPMSSQKPQSFPIQQAMSKIFAHCCRSSRLTFGPKTRGFLGERPEFSSVARAETDNFC